MFAAEAESPPLDLWVVQNTHAIEDAIPPRGNLQDATSHVRSLASLEGYKPKLAKSVELTSLRVDHGTDRQAYLITLGKRPRRTLTLLMPAEMDILPLTASPLSELNGAATYFKEQSSGPITMVNYAHSGAAKDLAKFWIDIAPCFYEEGTEFPDALDSMAGVVFENNFGYTLTETDVLGVGPDHRILNFELKKTKKAYGKQIKKQENAICAVLQKVNKIDPEPGRIMSLIGVYSGPDSDRVIDLSLSKSSIIYQYQPNEASN